MVKPEELKARVKYKLSTNNTAIGTYSGTTATIINSLPDANDPGKFSGKTVEVKVYYFDQPNGLPKQLGYSEAMLRDIVKDDTPGGGRRRTHRMLFKKWAAQEAREMSHKDRRMTFRKWAANELKEKSHPGNPSFKKWAAQEMREKSHTRRRR